MITNEFLGLHKKAVVIPAFNEAETIAEVVKSALTFAPVIVVDDGSADQTATLALAAGAIVVRHVHNRGYDAALESGLFEAIRRQYDYAVTLDADGQHYPELITRFVSELKEGSDVVVGIRLKHQRFSEALFAKVAQRFWNITDPLCGQKAYRLIFISKLGFFDSYKSVGTEFVIRASRSGLNVKNIPIPTYSRSGESVFGEGWKANYKILRALFLSLMLAKPFKVS